MRGGLVRGGRSKYGWRLQISILCLTLPPSLCPAGCFPTHLCSYGGRQVSSSNISRGACANAFAKWIFGQVMYILADTTNLSQLSSGHLMPILFFLIIWTNVSCLQSNSLFWFKLQENWLMLLHYLSNFMLNIWWSPETKPYRKILNKHLLSLF